MADWLTADGRRVIANWPMLGTFEPRRVRNIRIRLAAGMKQHTPANARRPRAVFDILPGK
jgi:hypothetical protein